MKRVAQPELSAIGEAVLGHYEQHLRSEEDLSAATVRNYLSDLRQFAAGEAHRAICNMRWKRLPGPKKGSCW